ncbi:MAG TPA: hypothetical protein VHJ78_13920 [Actinomycetota bacterium]|nr:hypothetical protein [Actinomycetota bacterium]
MRGIPLGRLLVLVAVMLASGACGGGEENNQPQKASPTPASTAAATPSGGTALSAAECQDYASSFAGLSADPAQAASSANFAQVAAAMEDVAGKVPADAAGDFQVVARAFRELAAGTQGLNLNDPAALAAAPPDQLQRMQQSLSVMNTEEVKNAVANVERFLRENCSQG